ncbi:MAG: hypothetical protein FWG65_11830 [Turicibacter sp.]|nr:hypothetical protein [Turicibacter sp.]
MQVKILNKKKTVTIKQVDGQRVDINKEFTHTRVNIINPSGFDLMQQYDEILKILPATQPATLELTHPSGAAITIPNMDCKYFFMGDYEQMTFSTFQPNDARVDE